MEYSSNRALDNNHGYGDTIMKKLRWIVLVIALIFLNIGVVNSAQVAIVDTDTLQEAWAKETLNNSDLQTNIDTKVTSGGDAGTPSAIVLTNATEMPVDEVKISEIGTATYDDMQDVNNFTGSAGRISGWALSDGGSGTVDVSAGKGFVRTSDSELAELVSFDLAATTALSLTDNDNNWIYVNYNAGTPTYGVALDITTINFNDEFIIGQAYREGSTVHVLTAGPDPYNTPYRLARRHFDTEGMFRYSGLVTTETGTRNLSMTSGSCYYGTTIIPYAAIDTSAAGTFTTHYHSSGSWTSTTGQTQVDYLQYDDGTDLDNIRNGRYGIHWVFKDYNSGLHLVYGTYDGRLGGAIDSNDLPDLPDFISEFSFLIAKIIVHQGTSSSLQSVTTAWETSFGGSVVINHNDNGNIQGGTTDEYYHMTLAQHTNNVIKTGTTTDNQVAVATADGVIETTSGLTYDGSNLQLTGDIGSTGTRITKGWLTDLEVTNAITGGVTGNAGTATVADESTDTTCFPTFVTAATGSLENKTDSQLTYDSDTGTLSATIITATDGLNTGTATDPYLGLLVTNAGDTDWWIGVNADTGGDNNDNIEFRTSATPGSNVHSWLEPDTGDIVFEGATDDAHNLLFDITDPTGSRVVTFDDNNIDFSHTTEDYVLKYNATTRTWSGEEDSTGSGSLGTNLSSTTNDITTDNTIIQIVGNSEDVVLTFGTNIVTATSTTDLATFDFGTINLATDALDLSSGSITNMAVGGLPDNTVDNGCMADSAIDTAELASGAVETAKIEDANVTAAKIADWYAYDTIPIAWANGGTSEPDDLDNSTREPYAYRTFAHDADEDLNFVWFVPSDLSGTTVQYRVKYLVTNATGPSAEGVAFGLSGVSLGDNDATNGTKGTVVVVTDTSTAVQHDILITGWSGDVTITNLLAGEVAELAIIRDVSDAADDYAQVVGVFAIEIRYVRNVAR